MEKAGFPMDGLIFRCRLCNKDKLLTKFKIRNERGRSSLRSECTECSGRIERNRIRTDVIRGLGGSCQCCAETDPRFLTVHHVNNDGGLHRRTYNEQQIYRQIRRENYPRDKYSLLCWNCHMAMTHYKICPHKDQ